MVFLAVACLAAAGLGCGPEKTDPVQPPSSGVERIGGLPAIMYGVPITSEITTDADVVTAVEVNVPIAAVENSTVRALSPKESFEVPFDPSSRSTFFDHLNIVFFRSGLSLPAYSEPLYALHFMGIDRAVERTIDCVGEPDQPLPENLPAGYKYLGPGLFPAEGGCVPGDGVHAVPTAAPEQQSPPGRFTATLLLGFHQGKIVHIEPMVSHALLLEKKSFSIPVPQPAKLGRKTRYPSTFDARYDGARGSFRFSFSGFREIE